MLKNKLIKRNLSPFKVGSVFNTFKKTIGENSLKFRSISLEYPSRLNAMAMDPSKIDIDESFRYTPGEVVFSISLFRKVTVSKRNDSQIVISELSKRPTLIRHAALLMKKALKFKEGFNLSIENAQEIRHCGFGSSSSLIASVACAINEAYGNPIKGNDLIKYLAQNHGEEIDGEDFYLNPVQCIGGSAAAGICKAGLILLAGESSPIAEMKIDDSYKVVIGIPTDVEDLDSNILMEKEIKALPKFILTGKKHGKTIAYNILHKMIPAMTEGDLKIIGDIIYDYRFNMGSINNCSFVYKKLPKLCKELSFIKKDNLAEVLSISSVGPAIFAITKKPCICKNIFESKGLKIYVFNINNNGYKILKKIKNV
ncbi:MAG: hypothetical protein AAB394_02645 [Patescibacteria group bacterium]